MPIRRIAALLLLLTIAVVAGCGTVDRGSAKELSSQGNKFASTTATAALASQEEFNRYLEGKYLVAALANQDKPTPQMTADVERVAKSSAARKEMLKRLGDVYSRLGDLASYDAAGEVESSVNGFTGAVNAFATSVGAKTPPISDITGKISSAGAGWLADYAQSQKLKTASALIRERLVSARDLLKREKTLLVSIREEMDEGSGKAALALWNKGVGFPEPILREQLGDYGLTYDAKQAAAAVSDPKVSDAFKTAIKDIVQARTKRQVEMQGSAMSDTIAGFDDLIAAHVKLEAGEQLSLESLTTRLAQMRGFVEEIEKAHSQK